MAGALSVRKHGTKQPIGELEIGEAEKMMESNEDIKSQIRLTLEHFNDLVSSRDLRVLSEFAPDDDVLLIGSEAGEVAKGKHELEAFFRRIYAREASYSWEWERIDASHAGDLVWFFAEGRAILTTVNEKREALY